jgi:outer membrane immunogenic protein
LRFNARDNDWLRLTSDDQRQVRAGFDGSVAMRRFLLAAAMFGAVSGAQAADLSDLPILRGALTDGLTTVNWRGYYVGGQWGYGSSDEDFRGVPSTAPLLQVVLTDVEREMGAFGSPSNFGKLSRRASGGGAFAGYNSQWDDVVIGLEASYLHGGFGGSSTTTETRSSLPLSDGYYHQVTTTQQASISIKDMATFRARAGYAYGCFLPYLFGGFALGNADIARTATVLDVTTPGPPNPPARPASPPAQPPTFGSASVAQHSHLIYGYSAGLGVDMMLYHGLFARAEWEYVRFTTSVDTSINTVRLGLGYKF